MATLTLLAALFYLFSGPLAVSDEQVKDQKSADRALFTFVHMTDTHCLTTTKNYGKPPEYPFEKFGYIKLVHWKDLAHSFGILEGAVQYINERIKPDFVIHTGDITDHGGLADLKKSKKIFDRLKCPYYACQGDHEVKKTRGVYNYVKVFKKRCRSFNIKGWHFIMMGIYPTDKEFNRSFRDRGKPFS